MKKQLRPASLLFNVLCLLVFFLVGMYFAGLIEAGKNQGLAGGAIVFGWGLIFAVTAFVASFFLTYRLIHKKIVMGNWALLGCLLLGYGITHYRFVQRDKLQKEKNRPYMEKLNPPTKTNEPIGLLISSDTSK